MMTQKKRRTLRRMLLAVAVMMVADCGFAQSEQGVSLSVQQNKSALSSLGVASHSLADGALLTIEFQNGKAVVTNGTSVVASLPCNNGGELVVKPVSAYSGSGILNCSVGDAGYSTLYSPFQLTVPTDSEVEAYAPTYEEGKLLLTEATRLAPGSVVAPETGMILKNKGDIAFQLSNAESVSVNSALSGSSLLIPTPSVSGQTIYTLGHAVDDNTLFGFYRYVGSTLAAGKAYLQTTDAQSSALAFVPFSFGDDITGIAHDATSSSSLFNGKRIENGQVVIFKNGKKYNVSGNRIH